MSKRILLLVPLLFLSPLWAEAQTSSSFKEVSERFKHEIDEAHQLAAEGKLDESIERLREILNEAPSEYYQLRLQYDLANLLFVQGRYREARAGYHRVLMMIEDQNEMVTRARERIAKMKDRESKKKDEVSIQLIDLETQVDLGQIPPEESRNFLRKIERNEQSIHQTRARELFQRVVEMENERARELLNQARHLFDKEKNYLAVTNILETIQREFPDTTEMPSVQILVDETERRLKSLHSRRPDSSSVPE